MRKIHGLLFAALLSMNLSCLSLDQEESHDTVIHIEHMNTEDQRTFAEIEKEINNIKKENEDPHFRSNTCLGATASLLIFSVIFQNIFITEALAYLYAGIGAYTRMDENEHIRECEAKINVLKNKQQEILAQHEHRNHS